MAIVQAENFFDSLGIKYEQSFGHDAGLIQFVRDSLCLLPADASVLDIGSGTGKPVSEMIIESGRKHLGIDFSPVMVDIARKQVPNGKFELTNMLDFAPEMQLTAAFTIFSLFQLSREEISAVVEKWRTWIAPGGYIFIGTMVAEDFSTKPQVLDKDGLCARIIDFVFMGERIGISLFTKQGWGKLLQHAGFEIVKTEMSLFEPPPEAESEVEPHFYITARKLSH